MTLGKRHRPSGSNQDLPQPGEVTVDAPAKLNLFFEVLARRDDGFHEIETLMCPISLCDTVHVRRRADDRITLTCHGGVGAERIGCADGQLPETRDNLVYRALWRLREAAGVSLGADVRLIKRIPVAAGLGGGSSDAAAALVAGNRVWGLKRSPKELSRLAAELGSDVPFFLTGTAAICRGRGERIEPVSNRGALHFVVVRPPDGLSTAAVYGVCRPAEHPRNMEHLLHALQEYDLPRVGRLLFNRLQSAAEGLSPWVERLAGVFGRQDVLGHGMSGSGTAYFALCRHAAQARRVSRRLAGRGIGAVYAVRSCPGLAPAWLEC